MKILKVVNQAVSVMIILMLALPLPVLAQGEGGGSQAALFSKEQLAQMLAPVALFPDALLSQVLMASTYPLEVVEADRWVKKNPGLEGDALDEALVDKEWDPSVKSLCHFPSILSSMSDKIAQTTRLGDAFLGQQDDVMAMVQELRAKAREAGNLKSTKEQNKKKKKETIIIESASPEVVYVPSYDPYYVYGPWWYPAYPPYYWWPRPAIIGAGLVFWPGIHIGLSIGVWSYFDWYNHVIVIDWRRTHKFHRHRGDRDGRDRGDRDRWRHDADHRRGVAYRNRATAQKFGQAPERSRESRRELRGFPERRTMDRQTRESIRQDVERAPMKRGETVQPERGRMREQTRDTIRQDVERAPMKRGETVQPERGRMREQIDRRERPVMPQKESIFGGGGDARRERMESERGRSSREQFNKGAREVIGPSPGINRGSDSGRGQGGSQGTSKGSSKGQSSGQDGRGDRGRMGR